jgi:uncharacterized protein (TIGR02996 family)
LDETAFLAAIGACPADDALRLVYGDWLEQRGDPRAEFLRLDCQLAAFPPEDARSIELRRQLAARFAGLERDWVATVCHGPVLGCPKAHWRPVRTWEQLQPLKRVDLRGRDIHTVRQCDVCTYKVYFTNEIEVVRQEIHVASSITLALDPRLDLSPEALEPSEQTRQALAEFSEGLSHDFPGDAPPEAAGEGLGPEDTDLDGRELPF